MPNLPRLGYLSCLLGALSMLLTPMARSDPKPSPPSKTGTDFASVEKFVQLPVQPSQLEWRKAMLGQPGFGPADYELLVWMELSAEDARALTAQLKPHSRVRYAPDDGGWLSVERRKQLKAAPTLDAAGVAKGGMRGLVFPLTPTTFLVVLRTR